MLDHLNRSWPLHRQMDHRSLRVHRGRVTCSCGEVMLLPAYVRHADVAMRGRIEEWLESTHAAHARSDRQRGEIDRGIRMRRDAERRRSKVPHLDPAVRDVMEMFGSMEPLILNGDPRAGRNDA